MKRMIFVVLLMICASTLTFAQTPADEEELKRLDQKAGDMQMSSSPDARAFLESLYTDDYKNPGPNNTWISKKEIIDQNLADIAKTTNGKYKSENFRIRFIDANTAWMTHTNESSGMFEGKAFHNMGRTTHVWVKRNGRWQLFSSFGAPMTDQQLLTRMERDWIDASKRQDTAWMESHYADEYSWTGPDGMLNDRKKDIADSKNVTFDSIDISDMQVHVNGDTGIVTGINTIKGKYMENGKSQDISGKYRFTDTFVKRDGEWKVIASQVTRMMSPQAEKK